MSAALGRGVYRHSCPNCGGATSEARLTSLGVCERCIPPGMEPSGGMDEVYRALRKLGRLKGYKDIYQLEHEARELINFFSRLLGSTPWGAQRTWIRRLARRDSFSIISPTGTGKTTFGIVSAIYLACRGEKSYIILPTTTLVLQVLAKLDKLSQAAPCTPRILGFHSKMSRKAREEALESLHSGSFHVLVTTAAFARKNLEAVSRHRYRLVFVDDVDAVLRSSRSVDTILSITGFTQEDLEAGMRMLRLQREAATIARRIQAARQAGREYEGLRARLRRVEEELSKLRARLDESRSRAASLIVSSATGRPRGQRVRLFRVLLGFEAGGRSDVGLRRVIDSYTIPRGSVEEEVVGIVKKLGSGVLVFVPIDWGVEGAERLAGLLREAGVRAEAYHSKKPVKVLESFLSGDLDALVGVANYYGTLVRGLDYPERIKYAVFAGPPRHKFPADVGEPHPTRLIRLLSVLAETRLDLAEEARRHLSAVRKLTRRLSPAALHYIAEKVMEGDVEGPGSPTRIVAEAYNFLRQALSDDEVWEHLAARRDIGVVVEDGRRYMLIADPATYIQASGRTSRLYAGGITLGLSIVVVDDERVFNGLVRRTRLMVETEWRKLEDLDLDMVIEEIEEDRKRVRKILREGGPGLGDLVKTALLVVESPNKARTIAGFFGQPSIRLLPSGVRAYEVATGGYILTITASGGHIYDLAPSHGEEDIPPQATSRVEAGIFGVMLLNNEDGREYLPVYTSIKRCMDCGHQFTADRDTCPVCGSRRIRDTRSVVEDLRRLAWEVDMVLVGTDPDTEGEKIGWDTAVLLKPYSRSLARLEFHEVTRKAILAALSNLRDFDQRLVDAQIVRRVEDRWIGFSLSPLLWCHFWPSYYCPTLSISRDESGGRFIKYELERCRARRYYYNLSAGRVQTPTLGWIVERTKQAKERINAYRLEVNGLRIYFREDQIDPKQARELASIFRGKKQVRLHVNLEKVDERDEEVKPPPPYSTDALIADASRYLRLGAPETMRLAQDLFEWGLITYHRTDSTRVSDRGIQVARQWLEDKYKDLALALFKPRTWGEGGAHEAIRPVRPVDADTLRLLVEEGAIELAGELTLRHLRLYDLVFRRFMASQMREALVTRARYRVAIIEAEVAIDVDVISGIGREGDPASRGFALVWPYLREQMVAGDARDVEVLVERLRISRVQPYTQGEVIQVMKERGIGRPSTYAKIVDTLLKRRYIVRPPRAREDYVVSTIRGEHVYHYLTGHIAMVEDGLSDWIDRRYLEGIPRLVSEERTRRLEEYMREIEEGKRSRRDVLDDIYNEIRGLAQPINDAIHKAMRGADTSPISACIRRAYVIVGTGGEVEPEDSGDALQG
ncbi:MAG: reverse gyrase [Desulfurococcales archaeon]|nr:reverse gyrase [Desulfurococcales archaeon]